MILIWHQLTASDFLASLWHRRCQSMQTMITYLCFLFLPVVVVVLSCFFFFALRVLLCCLSIISDRESRLCAHALRVGCGNVHVCLYETRNKAKNFSHYTKHYFIFLSTEKPILAFFFHSYEHGTRHGKCESLSSCIERAMWLRLRSVRIGLCFVWMETIVPIFICVYKYSFPAEFCHRAYLAHPTAGTLDSNKSV